LAIPQINEHHHAAQKIPKATHKLMDWGSFGRLIIKLAAILMNNNNEND
jgi:hypothetical protein